MKFFLILLLLGLVVFLLGMKHARPAQTKAPKPSAPGMPADSDAAPQTMLSCAHCGLHLPRDEALPGKGGVFCSAAHRAAFEAQQPPSGA